MVLAYAAQLLQQSAAPCLPTGGVVILTDTRTQPGALQDTGKPCNTVDCKADNDAVHVVEVDLVDKGLLDPTGRGAAPSHLPAAKRAAARSLWDSPPCTPRPAVGKGLCHTGVPTTVPALPCCSCRVCGYAECLVRRALDPSPQRRRSASCQPAGVL